MDKVLIIDTETTGLDPEKDCAIELGRGVFHELVRHRLAAFSQESTRYCNYGKSGQVTFIEPCFWKPESNEWYAWRDVCSTA